jgi:hypothetical protein
MSEQPILKPWKEVPWIDFIHICLELLQFPILTSSHLPIPFTKTLGLKQMLLRWQQATGERE